MNNIIRPFRIYAATFIVAFSTLAIEVTLSRLLSVITFYHLAFFAVSTAMLGMTAGAVFVYLKPSLFNTDNLYRGLFKSSISFALSIPVSVIILCIIPLSIDFTLMNSLSLLVTTAACSLPFYFSGIIISAVLTRYNLPINKLYASDLIGAAFGCIFVLAGLEIFDAQSLILLSGAVVIFAAFLFGGELMAKKIKFLSYLLFFVLLLSSTINQFTLNGIRPIAVKGKFEDAKNLLLERWNSHSRIIMSNGGKDFPQYWGASPVAPAGKKYYQYWMNIDGEAGTVLRKYSSIKDIEHLKYDVTNVAYFLRQNGSACIIGVGGGKDIQSAILFGHKKITGIDVNPIFVDLLEHRFRNIAGIADHEGVTLKVDEARSYLSRTEEKYNIIQMSLIDTWAATGAGAFSLSENALYTTEAWKVFLNRLTDDGIFTLSRWYSPANLGETGRVVSLAAATLLDMGINEPSKHIAMVTIANISTLMISKQPLSNTDLIALKKAVSDLKYNLAIIPGIEPENDVLRKIVMVKSREELTGNIKDQPLNYEPPTDENPYFFNMLKIKSLKNMDNLGAGVIKGNLNATMTLVVLIGCLLLLTIATVVIPMASKSHKSSRKTYVKGLFASGAFYFSLIGAGFMFIEIALIQRLSVYLGHPVYALGILLFTMILSTGIGSLLSNNLQVAKKPLVYLYPFAAVLAIILLKFTLSGIITMTITSGMILKIVISIIVIFPTGIILGIYFPAGMKLVKKQVASETTWYWALNGICGVLSSALAVFISIYAGISVNFYIAAIFYGLLIAATYKFYKAGKSSDEMIKT